MWFSLIPLIVVGFFLFITWDSLSPVRFFKQHFETRKQRKKEYEEENFDEDLS